MKEPRLRSRFGLKPSIRHDKIEKSSLMTKTKQKSTAMSSSSIGGRSIGHIEAEKLKNACATFNCETAGFIKSMEGELQIHSRWLLAAKEVSIQRRE